MGAIAKQIGATLKGDPDYLVKGLATLISAMPNQVSFLANMKYRQLGHNVQLGDFTAIAACNGIAGSTTLGKYCTIAGACGVAGHLTLADNVHITAMSLVTHSIPKPGVYSSGTAMDKNHKWLRNAPRFKQLEQMAKRIKHLELEIAKLNCKQV